MLRGEPTIGPGEPILLETARADWETRKKSRNSAYLQLESDEHKKAHRDRELAEGDVDETKKLLAELIDVATGLFSFYSLVERHGYLAYAEAELMLGRTEAKSDRARALFSKSREVWKQFLAADAVYHPLAVKEKREGLDETETVEADRLYEETKRLREQFEDLVDRALEAEYQLWNARYGENYMLAVRLQGLRDDTAMMEKRWAEEKASLKILKKTMSPAEYEALESKTTAEFEKVRISLLQEDVILRRDYGPDVYRQLEARLATVGKPDVSVAKSE